MAFDGDTDADLLAYIAMREEDEPAARAAGEEFSRRHRAWLERAVRRSRLYRLLGEGLVEDLVQETFIRVWERAETFEAPVADEEGGRRAVRAWLGQIANREAASVLRSTDVLVHAEPLPEVEVPRDETPGAPDNTLAQIAREELDRLPDREKDVILETLLYYKAGEAHQRLPNAVSQSLADRWSTTTENIRQVRSRTFGRLKDAITRRTGRQP